DVHPAVARTAEPEHLHGARARELPHRTRLALEARLEARLRGHLAVEELDRHLARELEVFRAIDVPVASLPDLLQDLVPVVDDVTRGIAHGAAIEAGDPTRVRASRDHPRIFIALPTFVNASTARSTCEGSCAALSWTRIRASPLGTTG